MIVQVLILFIIIWIAYDDWYRNQLYRSLNKIPKVSNIKLPLIGHAHTFFGNNEVVLATLQHTGREANKNGGRVTFWFGRRLFLVVTDAELLEYILKTFLEKDDLMNFLRDVSGNGTIFAPVSIWRPRRKLIAPAFSPAILKNFTETFAEKSQELVQELRKVSDGKPFHAWKYLASYTMDAVCQTNLGVNVSAHKNPDQPIIRALQMLFAEIGAKITQPWLQVNWFYNLLPRSKIISQSSDVIDGFINQIIKYRRTEKEKERNNKIEADRDRDIKPGKKQTFLNLLMDLSDEDLGGLSDRDLKNECLVIALAGTDTSAIAASFTMSMMARYPDVQEKVYQELKEVFGDSKQPVTNDSLKKLRYFDAVLRETLRLYPPVPVVTRKVDRPVTLKNSGSRSIEVGISIGQYIGTETGGDTAWSHVAVVREGVGGLSSAPLATMLCLSAKGVPVRSSRDPGASLNALRLATVKSGETLVPGLAILVNIWATHRNPKYWGNDAEDFRPERFLEPLKHPVQFIPFSQGLRNCLGYQYAMSSLKTALATVLREFRVLPHEELKVSTEDSSPGVRVEPKPMRLKFDIMMKDVDNFTIQLETRNKKI